MGFFGIFFSKNKIADNMMESPMVIVVYYVMLYCIMCDNNDTYLGHLISRDEEDLTIFGTKTTSYIRMGTT